MSANACHASANSRIRSSSPLGHASPALTQQMASQTHAYSPSEFLGLGIATPKAPLSDVDP
ncbi:hypothetical protein Vlu01_53480 [Micromonospora lutea]|uniref:FXSXX-COOH protein n=1 Tax=Micromonospora lutea TaxID=419825 RepID=A0ABQ4J3L4_9ACTN|nr:hypothetical protein Vlu01_53480 [Micromonospora lutea]